MAYILDVKNNIDPIAERNRWNNKFLETVEQHVEAGYKECNKGLKHSHLPIRVYQKNILPVIGELSIEQVNPWDIRAIITLNCSSNCAYIDTSIVFNH